MKKSVYLAVLAVSVLLTIHLLRETRRLCNQVQHLEEERRRAAVAAIDPGYVGVSDEEKERMIGIYRDIAQAYTNRDIMAMRIAMLKMPSVRIHAAKRDLGGSHKHRICRDIEAGVRAAPRQGVGDCAQDGGGDAEADRTHPCLAVGIRR